MGRKSLLIGLVLLFCVPQMGCGANEEEPVVETLVATEPARETVKTPAAAKPQISVIPKDTKEALIEELQNESVSDTELEAAKEAAKERDGKEQTTRTDLQYKINNDGGKENFVPQGTKDSGSASGTSQTPGTASEKPETKPDSKPGKEVQSPAPDANPSSQTVTPPAPAPAPSEAPKNQRPTEVMGIPIMPEGPSPEECDHSKLVIAGIDQQPSCNGYGSYYYVCQKCGGGGGTIVIGNDIPPLGHSCTVLVRENPGTCADEGAQTFKCERCKWTETKPYWPNKDVHGEIAYEEGTFSDPETFEEFEWIASYCTVCNKTLSYHRK